MDGRRSLPVATLGVVTALVLAPNLGLPGLLAHDAQRIIQVGALVYVTAWVATDREVRRRAGEIVLHHPVTWSAVALVAVLGVVSSLLAVAPWVGLLEVSLLAASTVAALAVGAEVAADPRRTLGIVVGGATLALVLQLAPLLTLPDLRSDADALWRRGALGGGFSHQRFLNQFQVALLPLVAALGASADRRLRWAGRVVATLTVWSIVFTQGRGATLVTAVAVVAIALLGRAGARRWATQMVGPLLLGIGGAALTRIALDARASSVGGTGGLLVDRPGGLTSDNDRFNIWRDALEQLPDSPWLGVGPGHLGHIDVVPDIVSRPWPAHPHNLPVQLVVEWGLPAGLLLTAVLAIAAIRMWWRRTDHDDGPVLGVPGPVVTAALTAAIAASLALSVVSGVLVMPTSTIALTLVGGAALGVATPTARHARDPGSPALPMALVAIGLAASVALASEVGIRPVTDQRASNARFVDALERQQPDEELYLLNPRFWLQGVRGLPGEP